MILTRSHGFTLVEALLALGVTALVAGAIATATFQIVKANSQINNRLLVVSDLQNSAKWLYLDGEKAETTSLVDEADPVDTLSLTWTANSIFHQSDYYLSGTELVREHNGNSVTVGRNVTSVDFSLSGSVITVNMASSAGNGSVGKQATYLIYLRPTE
jgi:type II secretory pathway pseudopilin PulG